MAKFKNDESNTLLVVYLPNGEIRKGVSTHHINNVFIGLQTQVLVRMQAGKPIEPKDLLKLIEDAQAEIKNMIDPSKNDE